MKSSSSLSLGVLCDQALAEHSKAEFAPSRLLGEDTEMWWERCHALYRFLPLSYQVAIQRRAPVQELARMLLSLSPLSQVSSNKMQTNSSNFLL